MILYFEEITTLPDIFLIIAILTLVIYIKLERRKHGLWVEDDEEEEEDEESYDFETSPQLAAFDIVIATNKLEFHTKWLSNIAYISSLLFFMLTFRYGLVAEGAAEVVLVVSIAFFAYFIIGVASDASRVTKDLREKTQPIVDKINELEILDEEYE
jgi:hypothetical protein